MDELNDLEDDVQLEAPVQQQVHGGGPGHAQHSTVAPTLAQHQRSRLKRLDTAAVLLSKTKVKAPLHEGLERGNDNEERGAADHGTQGNATSSNHAHQGEQAAEARLGHATGDTTEGSTSVQADVSRPASPAAAPSTEQSAGNQADEELGDQEGYWDEEDEYAQTLAPSQQKIKHHAKQSEAHEGDDQASMASDGLGSDGDERDDDLVVGSDVESEDQEHEDAVHEHIVTDRIGGGNDVEVAAQDVGGLLAKLQARRAAVAARAKAQFARSAAGAVENITGRPTILNPVDLGSLLARVKAKQHRDHLQQQHHNTPAADTALAGDVQRGDAMGMADGADAVMVLATESVGVSAQQQGHLPVSTELAQTTGPAADEHVNIDLQPIQCNGAAQGPVYVSIPCMGTGSAPQAAADTLRHETVDVQRQTNMQGACSASVAEAGADAGRRQLLEGSCHADADGTTAVDVVSMVMDHAVSGLKVLATGPQLAAAAGSGADHQALLQCTDRADDSKVLQAMDHHGDDDNDELEIVEGTNSHGHHKMQAYGVLLNEDEDSRPASQPSQQGAGDMLAVNMNMLPVRAKGKGSLKKCRLLGKGPTSRLSRLGSVQLVNHGIMPAAGQANTSGHVNEKDAPVGDGLAQPAPADGSDDENDIHGTDNSMEGSEVGDEEELVNSDDMEAEEEASGSEEAASGEGEGEEQEEDGEGALRGSDEVDGQGGGDSEQEGQESDSSSESGDNSAEELEAEPLAFEEMEPELEDDASERLPGKQHAAAPVNAMTELMKRARQKQHVHKPSKPRGGGGSAFLEVEAELSDDEAAVGAGPMTDDEDDDDLQNDGMLADLIGTEHEGAMDEQRRARLHKEWEADRDAREIQRVVHALRHGHKRGNDQRDMLGGEDGNDLDARRRRAQLFGDVAVEQQDTDNTQGMAEWAQALNRIAMADGEEVDDDKGEDSVADGATDKQAAEHREMRKRLRTAPNMPEEGAGLRSLARGSSLEVRAVVQAARATSLPSAGSNKTGTSTGPRPHNGPAAGAVHHSHVASRPPARGTTQFNVFGRDLTNKAAQPQGTSFVGRAPASGAHRPTSNAGRSFVFGTSEASNTGAGEASRDGSAGGKAGSASGKPTSFAGMKGLLGAGSNRLASVGGAQGGNPLAKQHQQQQAKQGNSLFSLLNDKSVSNQYGF